MARYANAQRVARQISMETQMTKTMYVGLALFLVAAVACTGNSACDSAEENLPKCGQPYYGDDNCELLTEDCTDDDLIVLDAAFQCVGAHCDDVAQCDIHFGRLSEPCLRSITGS